MKRMKILSVFGITLFILASCGSNPQAQSGSVQSTASSGRQAGPNRTYQPIIGAEGVPQPDWVRKEKQDADMMYFVGEGRDGKTTTVRKNSAIADANRLIGVWKESTIKAAIKDYVDEAGETGNTQSLERLQVASIQRAQANTSGIRQVESWIDQNGNYIVLVSYPKADLKRDFRTSVNTFVRNESAAFAEFKSEEAFKYLEQELESKQ